MRLALFGATGTIGAAVLARALAAGHEVRALVRDPTRLSPSPHLTIVTGDALDGQSVSDAVAGADAVIALVGPRHNRPEAVTLLETVAANVISAMRTHGVRRLVFVAGAGVALRGERWTIGQRLAGFVVRRFARWVVAAKERETELYRESALDWTALRPVRVRRGPATGRVVTTLDRPHGFVVANTDLAEVVVSVVEDDQMIGKAPFVSTRRAGSSASPVR